MLKTKTHIICFVVAFFCTSFSNVLQKNNEYELKAAFIYNFTKYIELNNSNNNGSTFVIGVLGNSPIIEALENYSINKTINNKRIEIIKLLYTSDAKNCQILFIPAFVSFSTIKDFINSESSKHMLIIAEKEGALDIGIAINFLLIENKIKFEISQNALDKNNIKASSQLLRLAINNKR